MPPPDSCLPQSIENQEKWMKLEISTSTVALISNRRKSQCMLNALVKNQMGKRSLISY
jgi:hypothetical protein